MSFWGYSAPNETDEDRRQSIGYQRLLNDVDDMYDSHMSSADRQNADTVKQQRLAAWKQLVKKYPAVDEDILYSTFKELGFSQWRAEDALTEMGIKPGYEGLDDDVKQPPQPTQSAASLAHKYPNEPILHSDGAAQLLATYPTADPILVASILKRTGNNFATTAAALDGMNVPRATPAPAHATGTQPSYNPFEAPPAADPSNPFAAPGLAAPNPFAQPYGGSQLPAARSPHPPRSPQPAANVPTGDLISFD